MGCDVSGVTWLALVALVALAVVAAACASRALCSASVSHAEQAAQQLVGPARDFAAAGLAAKVVASALPDQHLVEARR